MIFRKVTRTKIALALCWCGGLLMSLPMVWSMQLVTHNINVGSSTFTRSYCGEAWPMIPNGRLGFSLFVFLIQLLLPLLVITLAYIAIHKKLKNLPFHKPTNRLYRTQWLLISVVLVFTFSWLPLNIINILLDLKIDKKLG